MIEVKRPVSKKLLDDLSPEEIEKKVAEGFIICTGNGHIYSFTRPSRIKQVEARRVALDAEYGGMFENGK